MKGQAVFSIWSRKCLSELSWHLICLFFLRTLARLSLLLFLTVAPKWKAKPIMARLEVSFQTHNIGAGSEGNKWRLLGHHLGNGWRQMGIWSWNKSRRAADLGAAGGFCAAAGQLAVLAGGGRGASSSPSCPGESCLPPPHHHHNLGTVMAGGGSSRWQLYEQICALWWWGLAPEELQMGLLEALKPAVQCFLFHKTRSSPISSVRTCVWVRLCVCQYWKGCSALIMRLLSGDCWGWGGSGRSGLCPNTYLTTGGAQLPVSQGKSAERQACVFSYNFQVLKNTDNK